MKKRVAFVSNSSSCSFVLDVSALKVAQKNLIRHHVEFALKRKWIPCEVNAWEIKEEGDRWLCNTSIDNFDLIEWVTSVVGVPRDCISDLKEGHW
jgi:hypothetical protein